MLARSALQNRGDARYFEPAWRMDLVLCATMDHRCPVGPKSSFYSVHRQPLEARAEVLIGQCAIAEFDERRQTIKTINTARSAGLSVTFKSFLRCLQRDRF